MAEQRENAIERKSFAFAVRIVRLSQFLREEKREFVLSKQILRSGTSIGAMCGRLFMPPPERILSINCTLP